MSSLKFSIISSNGECLSCRTNPPEIHILQCSSCSIRFHGICKKVQTTETQCCKTFIEYFNIQTVKKLNFSLKCESCILKRDTEDKVTMASTVMSLATKIDILNAKFDELKDELPLRTQQPLPPKGSHGQIRCTKSQD